MKKSSKFPRRSFIVGASAVAGGGLALGFNIPDGIKGALARMANGAGAEVNDGIGAAHGLGIAREVRRFAVNVRKQNGHHQPLLTRSDA